MWCGAAGGGGMSLVCLGTCARKKLILFSFFFHATDQSRAEINRNSFPAHFISGILMGLEVDISVHGTDRETDTSRITLDDQNAEILQITAICILDYISRGCLSNLIFMNICQPFILTSFALPWEQSAAPRGRHYSHATFNNQISPVLALRAGAWVLSIEMRSEHSSQPAPAPALSWRGPCSPYGASAMPLLFLASDSIGIVMERFRNKVLVPRCLPSTP